MPTKVGQINIYLGVERGTLGVERVTRGLGRPMYASLGEILTLGLGRGEGIGPKFVPGAAGVILGERFTFSSALNCSAVG